MWVLCGSWLVLNLTFGYVFTYLSYRSEDGSGFAGGGSESVLLAQMMPYQAPVTLVQGMPMFGGALLMILGAMTVGNGYGWGTWKTVFTAGPSRITALGGHAAGVASVVAGLDGRHTRSRPRRVVLVAAVEHQPASWPTVTALAQGYGSALLIGGMWTAAGVLLGTLARGPALAVGLGLVWSLVVENLLRGVAVFLGPLQVISDVLPGTAAGSLAGAIGAAPPSDPNGTPGVNTILGGTGSDGSAHRLPALFAIGSLGLTARRDIAS